MRLHPSQALAYERLRAAEYIDRRRWISPRCRNREGGETDRFDDAASHFSVMREGLAIGGVRLVRPVGGHLPVLESFPEIGESCANATEVSRYIARVPLAAQVLRAVIVAELLRSESNGVAIISVGLAKLLERRAFVLRRLAGPRPVGQYGKTPQIAVEIDALASSRNEPLVHLVPLALEKDWAGVMSAAQGGRTQ